LSFHFCLLNFLFVSAAAGIYEMVSNFSVESRRKAITYGSGQMTGQQ
jgi:hypothetical protein